MMATMVLHLNRRVIHMLRRIFFFRWIRTVFAILMMFSLCCGFIEPSVQLNRLR
uniref:UV radiation resistance associated n=1 Tax=Rousettus aegyptiacus TaxID=9407 RepID=A0A7J8HA64_ROUAE|nr:UV radiation resistance associated [Rousettus aegyptiacus]